MRFRLRPGEDGSCLNLYKPTSPRIIAPAKPFVDAGGFRFAASIAETDAERQNPWRLLDRRFPDGAVPVIGDANSLQYVLHVAVGEDILLPGPGGQPVTLRVVAALSDSLFQSELVIAESQFVRLFPRLEGYRFFTVRAPEGRNTEVATALEEGLGDYGFDAQSTARAPGVVPPRREHVPVDLPGAWRAGPVARHAWARRDPAAQRAGAPS